MHKQLNTEFYIQYIHTVTYFFGRYFKKNGV
ncbi:hypothetical protein SAMN05421780_101653 [Flexibacter flexilis DSM 6793]|uniref:Uncharacterized protein n=1 Tax=Flexibacter flexilis DSM 6793 TaxID=927664 RepID=A0A1I1ECC2_9BACT|nr:hypothetical protein SAMN05421780_101653 [Flexibacter flexilis DSM 6793]